MFFLKTGFRQNFRQNGEWAIGTKEHLTLPAANHAGRKKILEAGWIILSHDEFL